jgi:hypothetical protein
MDISASRRARVDRLLFRIRGTTEKERQQEARRVSGRNQQLDFLDFATELVSG